MVRRIEPAARPAQPEQQTCWLCGRELGARVQSHHLVPKARGGREVAPLHPICHRTIHAHASNGELARMRGSRAVLLEVPAIAAFVRWVADKPPDFHAPVRKAR